MERERGRRAWLDQPKAMPKNCSHGGREKEASYTIVYYIVEGGGRMHAWGFSAFPLLGFSLFLLLRFFYGSYLGF